MTNQDTIAQIEELARLGLFDAAESACRELLARASQEHKAWAWLGMLALARRRPDEAEPAVRQAIALYPHDPRYWNTLSLSLRMQGKPADAEIAARNALTLDDAGGHWAELGNCLYDQQRWSDASQAYHQALRRNPNDAQIWTNLGGAEHPWAASMPRRPRTSAAWAWCRTIPMPPRATRCCKSSEAKSIAGSIWFAECSPACPSLCRRGWCWEMPSACAIDCRKPRQPIARPCDWRRAIGTPATTWRWCSCSGCCTASQRP